ncbi:MAG: hypothetical protein UU34_C0027G0008 [Candidatus Curtissbacteria bacterium GW2011_GWA1_41_11]|uniref:N-acetyltransferase domain-containing protein n=1 Tax=Candidatus Curtissbacteria bacterium GW2011_GWA1_41_11 TaxID=1618409 RepID=A0A0G0UA74_9BACT|nr:MAG: hypothetical protein UU34_C0027G0008 [Candidatus Curtissbacteria bacterium GW2011_GWA1_41_11]
MRTEAPIGSDPDVAIRPYVRSDFTDLEALLKSIWPQQDLNPNRALKYVVAKNAGQIVGAILCDEVHRDMHLTNLAVRTEFRRRKIATSLIQAAETRAAGLGLENLRLIADNDDLVGFYQDLGFVLTDMETRTMVKALACLSTN